MSECWAKNIRPFGHEWCVRVFAVGNKVCVEPNDGNYYITKGMIDVPWVRWHPGGGRYSSNPKTIEKWKVSCQKWCDKKNAKAAATKAKLKAAGLPTMDNCIFCGEEHVSPA